MALRSQSRADCLDDRKLSYRLIVAIDARLPLHRKRLASRWLSRGLVMDPVTERNLVMNTETLSPELLHKMDAYWRAANYISVGQIYLYDNPLLKEPLKLSHVKPLVVGHWGTTPGQNFIYVHLNRVIKKYDLDMFYIAGPGHGGPALVGNTYLEGTYSEIYPNISQDEAGLKKLFKQFSFPGGIRFGMAVALMFVAILIYVLSDDLSWGPQ